MLNMVHNGKFQWHLLVTIIKTRSRKLQHINKDRFSRRCKIKLTKLVKIVTGLVLGKFIGKEGDSLEGGFGEIVNLIS